MKRLPRVISLASVGMLVLGCAGGDKRAIEDSIQLARANRCGEASNAVVSASGVGVARLGLRLRDVAASCSVIDTVAALPGTDGLLPSAVYIGRNSALLFSRDSVITSIVLTDSAFRTDRGVGVGSRIRTLRFAYGRVCVVDSHGEAVLAVAGLDGLTFSFDPSSLPAGVYRNRILGTELRSDAADELPVRSIRIGQFKSPCREQRLANGR